MITGIRDLDRKIVEYVRKEDHLALLLTNRYICSLFDEIFFRNKLLRDFNFSCKFDTKKYYSIVRLFNMINDLLKNNRKICVVCDNSNDGFWNQERIINSSFSKIQYSQNRDEISLYLGLTDDSVLFTTDIKQTYTRKHPNGVEIKYDKFKIVNARHCMHYFSAYNVFCDKFTLTVG